jgi:hypothetical protein
LVWKTAPNYQLQHLLSVLHVIYFMRHRGQFIFPKLNALKRTPFIPHSFFWAQKGKK